MGGMSKEWKPPKEDVEVFAQYKAHIEGERKLKPEMEKAADRALADGATVGQLARHTGLTPEVFRRRARKLGIEHKRAPTVGKLSPPPAPPARRAPEEPPRAPAVKQRRPRPEPREGRVLTDEEAKSLAELARSRASEMQLRKLEQNAEMVSDGYKDFTTVNTAMGMGLLTHDEVYAEPTTTDEAADEERPASSGEASKP